MTYFCSFKCVSFLRFALVHLVLDLAFFMPFTNKKDFFLFSFLSATIVTNNNNNNNNNNKNNNNNNKTAHSKLSVYGIKILIIHD